MVPDVTDIDGLARRYGGIIERYVMARLGCAKLAEDICQEVLLRAWLRPPVVECEAQLRAWLFQVAGNLVIDAVRSPGIRQTVRLEDLELTRAGADPIDVIDARDALEALPRPDRVAVLMHACGYSLAEVGSRLSVSEEAARKRVARARAKLRRAALAPLEDGVRAA
jgi:RNA polymerase sigma-70 factor (ECF subfamily)